MCLEWFGKLSTKQGVHLDDFDRTFWFQDSAFIPHSVFQLVALVLYFMSGCTKATSMDAFKKLDSERSYIKQRLQKLGFLNQADRKRPGSTVYLCSDLRQVT